MTGVVAPGTTVGFLGPPGTFTEEALRSEPGLAGADDWIGRRLLA